MRPSVELATTASLTATRRSPFSATSSVESSTTSYWPANARRTPSSSSSPRTAVRNPTRPKFTPKTGTPVPRNAVSARSIVPSPPSTMARSASTAASSRSSTPASAATFRSRSSASATRSGRPCAKTAARSTDRIGDRSVEVGGEGWCRVVDEVEDELTVPLRAWKPRVYEPGDARPPRERRLRHLPQDPPVHVRLTDNALRRIRAPRLELRLDEHERSPRGRREPQRRREREPDRDERDVARHELRRERELRHVPGVDALEHRHARVLAQPRVQLAVPDVEGDHPRRPSLEQDVGEAAGRRADVECVNAGDVDPERVERVRQLVAGARDVRRRPLHLERRILRDLLARLGMPRDEARHHERLRLRARLGEAALDEQDVEPLPHG